MAGTSIDARKGASSHIPPELITQITQSVIKQLQTGRFDEAMPLRPFQNSFLSLPYPLPQPIPQSLSNAPEMPHTLPYQVYDPPSPYYLIIYPSYISPQSDLREEQKATYFARRRSLPPSSENSETNKRSYTRLKGLLRLSTDKGITILERIWGPLFDKEGYPTLILRPRVASHLSSPLAS